MTAIQEMLLQISKNANRSNTEQCSEPKPNPAADIMRWRCDQSNAIAEKMPELDGFSCTECGDKGGKYETDGFYLNWVPCPRCSNVRKGFYLLKKSGLENKTFDSFKTENDWQRALLKSVMEYSRTERKWLYIGGQSGCGKTHLCTAAIREAIFKGNVSAALFKWVEDARTMKASVNDSGYGSEADRFRKAEILYIDDMFKGGVTAADLKLAYDLIDHRYRHGLRTVISSELYIDEVIAKDEALGGRIKEMAGEYSLNIARGKGKNYRL